MVERCERKNSHNLAEGAQRRPPKNTAGSAGGARVCLSATPICMRNQMKDCEAARRCQKRVTLSQPLLSVSGLFPYVDTPFCPAAFSQLRVESASCVADVKSVSVSNRFCCCWCCCCCAFQRNTLPVRA